MYISPGDHSDALLKHVGLFGGSFDPPHVGHLLLAERLREECALDEVVWMPASTSPHKVGVGSSSPRHRYAMVELAIAGNRSFTASDLEIRRAAPKFLRKEQ